ncbi:hypothetical protein LTR10_011224 [Elasticomyces elasticus]|uniref:Uncharacterized protein n=1 Tax=Elasticomyces elasticus TaxID=574655 RepID=A0AAN7VT19_9PEZI|nr:hypothetical protein LTR10_011224 [Elasticomyces elasticus]KAK4966356.1 hypothetical protein LTR42_011519 [Elasticomyces elasticus]KAK5692017.1 hypothetical protein LTR97_011190 [Elasticomyces elasticus]KAK5717254.1 hypothetical protein LTR15_009145 [Elasticomyces elasticus]
MAIGTSEVTLPGDRMMTPNSLSALEVSTRNNQHLLADDSSYSWDWESSAAFSHLSPLDSLPSFSLDDMMTGFDNTIPGLWADVDFEDIFGSAGASGRATPAEDRIPPNAQQAMGIIRAWKATTQKLVQDGDSSCEAFLDWCSSAPDPYMYDLDVLDIWISIAVERIGPTFLVFNDFRVDESTGDTLYIAMAAVGGVYCAVENSFQLAKVMFNDARRLALAMFVLLEIYGIVSGDKRSFELVDVFHADLHQAVRALLDACNTTPLDKGRDGEIEL